MESKLAEALLNSIRTKEKAVVLEFKDNLMIKIVDSAVALVQRWRTVDGHIYAGEEGKMAVVGFSGDPPQDIGKEAMNNLIKSPFFFALPRNEREMEIDVTDVQIIKSISDPSSLINDVLNMLSKKTGGVITLEKVERHVTTSGGFAGVEKLTTFTSHFRVFNGEFTGHWATTGSRLDLTAIKKTISKAEEYASITNQVEIDEGKHRVILSPMVFSNLLQLAGRMASAMSVEMGSSIFTKVKPEDDVFSPLLSLYDRPLSDMRPIFFDDEGTETYDKAIIENGKFKTLLFNTSLANRHGVKSTGNAGWTYPAPWNIEVVSGGMNEDDLLAGNGVLFTNNWYTRLQNSMEGIFSTVGRDAILLIKDGKVVGRSKGRLRLAGKLGDLLRNIEAISKVSYPIKWWEVETPTKSPFVEVSSFSVTKSQSD